MTRKLAGLLCFGAMITIVLIGCASPGAGVDRDPVGAATLATLAPVAVLAAEVPSGADGAVECWRPGEHLVASGGGQKTYRVICRVPFEEAGQNRYRDVICVGELGGPAPDHCVRWAQYTDEPRFEDAPAVRAS